MPKVQKADAERSTRLLAETKKAFDGLVKAKELFERKRNALVGQFNITQDEHEDFNPLEDAIGDDGTILKGHASDEQKQVIASDNQIREMQRQQRMQQRAMI